MDLTRSITVFDPEMLKEDVHIIGAGATGSFVIQTLARFGVKKMHIYDMDVIEKHNISNQNFALSDCGKLKITATAEYCRAINPEIEIVEHPMFVEPKDIEEMSGYVFVLVDTMKSRKELFQAIKSNPKIKWYWESRLGSDQARVYSLPIGEDINYFTYEDKHFYSDDQAEVSACGTSITIVSIVQGIVSLMVNQFIKVVMERRNAEPYLNHYTLFDSMFNVYVENFHTTAQVKTEVVDEIIM